mmetsp:Transcript_1160/g.3595  ORF Transcript_1160/g.3595 Transcript_1160/m.3595 type:complete len:194 (+) Transcript_1160:136-717(+)
MVLRRDYSVTRRLKVVLVVRSEVAPFDGELVVSLSKMDEVTRCVIRGRGHKPQEVIQKASSSTTLRVLTILLDNGRAFEEWTSAVDPGWRAGPSFTAAVGLAVISLGVVGYVRKGSKPSVIAGSLIGVPLCGSAWAIRSGRKPRVGHVASAGLSLLLAGSLGPKALETKTLYPGGGLAAASALASLYNLAALF